MPFRASALPLQHILDSIAHIEGFLADADMDFATYQADLKTKSAVERQMQIVTEAAFRLGEDAQTFCPEIDWRAIRGMGNRLPHWYDKISDRIVWDAIQIDLPPLKAAVAAALKRVSDESHVDPA